MMTIFDNYLANYKERGIDCLRESIPEIKRLESLDYLKDLKLTSEGVCLDNLLILKYRAVAPELFPPVIRNMRNKGMFNKYNFFGIERDKNKVEDNYTVLLRYYGGRLQVSLDIYKAPPSLSSSRF